MPGAGREAGLFGAGHLVRQRAGRGGPGCIGGGSRRRGPIMPGHLQEGFGCVVTNRFDQLFDDESDPFEVLRAAETRRKESGGGGSQGGGGARGGPAGAQTNSSGGAGGGGPGQAGAGGGGVGSAAKQLRRESQKERKNPLPPFAASAGGPGDRREEGSGQPGAPLRKEGERGAAAGEGTEGRGAGGAASRPAAHKGGGGGGKALECGAGGGGGPSGRAGASLQLRARGGLAPTWGERMAGPAGARPGHLRRGAAPGEQRAWAAGAPGAAGGRATPCCPVARGRGRCVPTAWPTQNGARACVGSPGAAPVLLWRGGGRAAPGRE